MSGKFQIDVSAAGSYYFRLKEDNGTSILNSEIFASRHSAEKAMESVRMNATNSGRYERRTDNNGRAYFVLKAGDDHVIGRSRTYATLSDMEQGIQFVKTHAPHASVDDFTISKAA